MATVVQDSKDLVASLEQGKIIEPADVIADRVAPVKVQESTKTSQNKPADQTKTGQNQPEADPDDVEGDDGLTPRQKREWTESMRKTIGKKHRQLKEAESFAADHYNKWRLADERAAALERENADLKKKAEPPKQAEQSQELIRPKREAFETQEAYEDALLAYGRAVDKAEQAKEQAEQAKRQQEEERQKVVKAAEGRIERARELVEDFDEKVKGADLAFPDPVADYIWQAELFAELAYYFANNPEERKRIANMPIVKGLVAIGKIEDKLQPFAPKSAASTGAKASNGSKPNTESASSQSAASDDDAGPSTETESDDSLVASPSETRETAPVIRPLSSPSTSQVEKPPAKRNTREEIEAFRKRTGSNMMRRQRH